MDKVNNYGYPGQVDLQQLKLISIAGLSVDLNDYLIELNIYEDIFSNFIHGQVMVSDSINLITKLPIVGDEILVLSYGTPTLEKYFKKYFHVYSITDQKTVSDNNTQTYILHFCSVEAVLDANLTIYDPFSGDVSDIASKIFEKYLKNPRYVKFEDNNISPNEEESSELFVTETNNKIKFISPGWSPAKCLNWLAGKAIPREGKACDFLFWESSAGFFFASIEDLINDFLQKNIVAGEYYYVPPGNIENDMGVDRSDVVMKMFLAESFEIVNYTDNLQNYTNGFFASKIITYDPITKTYDTKEYDYPTEFLNFKHTDGEGSLPPFSLQTLRNPSSYAKIYPTNSKLFSDITENYTEKITEIFGNRNSKLNELNNFKINLTVHGRSDLFAGSMIRFNLPDTRGHGEPAEGGKDPLYSGNYIVSAIRHKINFKTHVMVMELIKTSIASKAQTQAQPAGFSSTII